MPKSKVIIKMTSKIRVLSVLFVLGASAYLIIALFTAAFGFGRAGGQLNVLSHSNTIEADTVGDIVAIAGNRNSVDQQPAQPRTEPPQETGMRPGVAFGLGAIVMLLGLIIYVYVAVYRRHPIEVKTNETS